jgi:hypothetical protein
MTESKKQEIMLEDNRLWDTNDSDLRIEIRPCKRKSILFWVAREPSNVAQCCDTDVGEHTRPLGGASGSTEDWRHLLS